ncbi:hypothetical protein ACU61A_37810 [Pseudonocardia sichuanensis]
MARTGDGRLVYTGLSRSPWGTMAERLVTPFEVELPAGADPLAVAAGMNPGMSGWAWCMTTYSGMGASSALRGGAALGAAVAEHPDDLAAALDAWETALRPFITRQQDSARVKQQRFVPSSRPAEALRSVVLGVARRIVHRRRAAETTAPPAPVLSGTPR